MFLSQFPLSGRSSNRSSKLTGSMAGFFLLAGSFFFAAAPGWAGDAAGCNAVAALRGGEGDRSDSPPERPNAVSIDLAPPLIGIAAGGIGFGTSYERAVFGYLSLKAGGGIIYVPFAEYDISGNYLAGSLIAGVRGYPAGRAPRGPYLGMHGGYIGFSVRGNEAGVSSSMSLHLPFISAEAGWKFVFGRRRVGFFLEPYIHFMFVFEGVTLAAMGNISSVTRSGSTLGLLVLGFNLGLVF